jgi:hypothetical protein
LPKNTQKLLLGFFKKPGIVHRDQAWNIGKLYECAVKTLSDTCRVLASSLFQAGAQYILLSRYQKGDKVRI